MEVTLNEDFTRAWIDDVEQPSGSFFVVSVEQARAMGVITTTPVPEGANRVFIYGGGFAFLERTT